MAASSSPSMGEMGEKVVLFRLYDALTGEYFVRGLASTVGTYQRPMRHSTPRRSRALTASRATRA